MNSYAQLCIVIHTYHYIFALRKFSKYYHNSQCYALLVGLNINSH